MAVAATSERVQSFGAVAWQEQGGPALVLSVQERAEDETIRRRSARFIGAIAMGHKDEVTANYESGPGGGLFSLQEALKRAAAGDESARKLVEANVRSDVIERTIKAGHVMRVKLGVNDQGKIMQHGQTMESVHANALNFSSGTWQMRERAEAETRNAFRIESLHRQGLLGEYAFVVFSRAADNMTVAEMDSAGFFTDTMSCAVQLTSAQGVSLTTESAFVAGVKSPGGERHDGQTVARLGTKLGVDYADKAAAEVIDTPLLIHKSLLPHGAIDLVQLYDSCADGTFFGEAQPPQNYPAYLQVCRHREQRLAPKVQSIVEQLVAAADQIETPLAAVQRLHDLSEKHMVEQAITDTTINPRVFGTIAAAHIEQARLHYELGNTDLVQAAISKAQASAISSSCPSALQEAAESARSGNKTAAGEQSSGKKEKMKCPFCGDPDQYGDPCSPQQHCTSCDARVRAGQVISKGNGGRKNERPTAFTKLIPKFALQGKRQQKIPLEAEAGITMSVQPRLHLQQVHLSAAA